TKRRDKRIACGVLSSCLGGRASAQTAKARHSFQGLVTESLELIRITPLLGFSMRIIDRQSAVRRNGERVERRAAPGSAACCQPAAGAVGAVKKGPTVAPRAYIAY